MKHSEILRKAAALPFNNGGKLVNDRGFCPIGALRYVQYGDAKAGPDKSGLSLEKSLRDYLNVASVTSWFDDAEDGSGNKYRDSHAANRRDTPTKLLMLADKLEAEGQ